MEYYLDSDYSLLKRKKNVKKKKLQYTVVYAKIEVNREFRELRGHWEVTSKHDGENGLSEIGWRAFWLNSLTVEQHTETNESEKNTV